MGTYINLKKQVSSSLHTYGYNSSRKVKSYQHKQKKKQKNLLYTAREQTTQKYNTYQ